MKWTAVKALMRKEWHLDWSNKTGFGGALLQLTASVLIVYLAIPVVQLPVWNALLFIVVLFNAGQILSRIFLNERPGQSLFLHTLASPKEIIMAKLLYNGLISSAFVVLASVVFFFFMGYKAESSGQHMLILVLFAIDVSLLFTMAAAIGNKTKNGSILSVILALPLTIPVVLVSIKAGKNAMDGIVLESFWRSAGILGVLGVLIFMLSLILYPSVWRD